jgi:hypothetical protein
MFFQKRSVLQLTPVNLFMLLDHQGLVFWRNTREDLDFGMQEALPMAVDVVVVNCVVEVGFIAENKSFYWYFGLF